MHLILLCLIGYLVGSIPSGFLLTKYTKGIDLREFGSHSTGATNVFRTGEKKLAALTLLLDVFKGLTLTLYLLFFESKTGLYIGSFCCLIGHVYPVWLGFKGGKGVATAAGIFLAIAPVATVVSMAIWGVVAKFVKISAIASIAFVFSFVGIIFSMLVYNNSSLDLFLFSLSVFIFILYSHSDNIKKILSKD